MHAPTVVLLQVTLSHLRKHLQFGLAFVTERLLLSHNILSRIVFCVQHVFIHKFKFKMYLVCTETLAKNCMVRRLTFYTILVQCYCISFHLMFLVERLFTSKQRQKCNYTQNGRKSHTSDCKTEKD